MENYVYIYDTHNVVATITFHKKGNNFIISPFLIDRVLDHGGDTLITVKGDETECYGKSCYVIDEPVEYVRSVIEQVKDELMKCKSDLKSDVIRHYLIDENTLRTQLSTISK